MRNLTHLALPLITSSEGYGTSLVSVVLLLFTLLALLSVFTTLFIIGLVVCALLLCSTLHLLFIPILLTVLAPVIQTLLATILCSYGASHRKSYSFNHIAIGNLVREIRSTHTFIPHFNHSELEAFVSAVVS